MKLVVRRSLMFVPHSGERGLFSCDSVDVGADICEMKNRYVRVFDSRHQWIVACGAENKPDDGAVQIGPQYVTDWSVTSRTPPKWYYMNHSRVHANVKMSKRDGKIVWVAISPISPGDELKFDYGRVPPYYLP